MADMDMKQSSPESSDREGDAFEDAPDMASRPRSRHSRATSTASGRSLTSRSKSPPNSTPRPTDLPSAATGKHAINSTEVVSPNNFNVSGERHTSPLLTTRTISTFDEIHLQDVKEKVGHRGRSETASSNGSNHSDRSTGSNRSRTSTSSSRPKLTFRPSGLSGSIPQIPWGPPPPPHKQSMPAPTPATRKLASPFTWLSRSQTQQPKKESPSPPQRHPSNDGERRATVSSVGSNPELMLNRLDQSSTSRASSPGTRGLAKGTLRDRFKMLRLREEAGIQSSEHGELSSVEGGSTEGSIKRSATVGLGIEASENLAEEKEGPAAETSAESRPKAVPRTATIATIVDPSLRPGTVVGATAGPSSLHDPAAPVDWDLWQSVVYEGPAAVARTSPEELNRAIATGIPSAIRGVVWQVLAQSKNEELEDVYRDLAVRGTKKEWDSTGSVSAPYSTNTQPSSTFGKDKEQISSAASSVHSEQSSPATVATTNLTSPSSTQDPEEIAKFQATMVAERKKRVSEDAAALKKLEKQIKRDLGARTSFSKYAVAAGLQDALYGVCKAYALFDDGVGYAQGMSFLVMPLLFNMPEEEAFCLLVRLMNQYHMRELFIQDMPGLHLHLYQFERLLEDLEPALYCHLHRRGVSPHLYATQWFLTLFAYRFPLQLVLRIYDLVLSEGLEGAILKFGIALMQKNAETLLTMDDMSSLKTFLTERIFDVYIDQAPSAKTILESGFFGSSGGKQDKEVYHADTLVQDACAVKLTPELLQVYTTEWEDKKREEEQRETELEGLRSTNASLTRKVRSLEERAEKSDNEHVQMATEVVRIKVENEELQDSVESFKGQVEELKKLVENQPLEVEERLKAEMDRIMERNAEVQNENRALEEQMADMEKNLVETKMQFAEINSEYETLKQKFVDLRKALEV